MLTFFIQQLRREWLMHSRQLRLTINSSVFFLMIMIFFPLAMPSDPVLLRNIAPGLAWIALLLSFMLSADRLFQQDFEDGVIEQWLISGQSIAGFVIAKLIVNWLFNLLPLLLITPIIAVLFGLTAFETTVLLFSIICGSPALLLLCALTVVFSGGLKQKSVFMGLILLPLTIPIMIFGSGTLIAALAGIPISGFLAILVALSLLAAGFLPFAIASLIQVTFAE